MNAGSQPRSLYWVDAFTQIPFTGNPAVVVPAADGLTDAQMQAIAREVNCSETAFVMSTQVPDADLRLRWFTPTQEVNLCGHATVATLHTLAELGQFNLRPQTHQILYLETRSGVLPVTVDYAAETPWIWLTLPLCDFKPLEPEIEAHLAQTLGQSFPVSGQSVVDTLNHDVLISIGTLDALQQLTPDVNRLATLGRQQGWRGVCVYTTETMEPHHAAHSRFFAPQSGIVEDPVTGSVSGPLALHLSTDGQDRGKDTSIDMVLEQGDCLQRPGRVRVQLSDNQIKLGGQAVTVMQGAMNL